MKSLDKLRRCLVSEPCPGMDLIPADDLTLEDYLTRGQETSGKIADEIQAEVDKFYFPRPLFEDGEPMQFGDEFVSHCGMQSKAEEIVHKADGSMIVYGKGLGVERAAGERFQRPSESDTQEKIDSDLGELLGIYVDADDREAACAEFSALLERQRKVCEARS